MRLAKVSGLLVAAAVCLLRGTGAEAQLPKQGTYTGIHAFSATGTVYELEKGHLFWAGLFTGPFLNDAGSGFLHGTSWLCPGVNDIVDGVSVSHHGYCVATDADSDKVFTMWQGPAPGPGKFVGSHRFVGGTGKYAGIKGHADYRAVGIGQSGQGYGHHTGEWQLP